MVDKERHPVCIIAKKTEKGYQTTVRVNHDWEKEEEIDYYTISKILKKKAKILKKEQESKIQKFLDSL